MAIYYIQSRGKNQDKDYRWLRVKSNEYYPENPDFLLQPIKNLSLRPIDLIESQKFSLILVAKKNDYYLLITGLESKTRTDFMGRSLRNSLFFVGKKDSNNIEIRSLLIRALRGEIDGEIDKVISDGDQYGFEVDYTNLKQLLNSTLAIENIYQTDLRCKIGNNCDYLREELALELESNVLPDREGLLVLVSSIKSASSLKTTGVWRGLSNRVESEKFEKYGSLDIKTNQAQKKTIWLLIAIAIVIIIAILITVKLVPLKQSQIEKLNSPSIQNPSPNSLKMDSSSIELPPLTCQIAKEENLFLSPCFLNNKDN